MSEEKINTKAYVVCKASIMDSLGNKCHKGQEAQLTNEQSKQFLANGIVMTKADWEKANKPAEEGGDAA